MATPPEKLANPGPCWADMDDVLTSGTMMRIRFAGFTHLPIEVRPGKLL